MLYYVTRNRVISRHTRLSDSHTYTHTATSPTCNYHRINNVCVLYAFFFLIVFVLSSRIDRNLYIMIKKKKITPIKNGDHRDQ